MPGRHINEVKYRFGYNGMEKDDELKLTGNSYTTEFRQYDPRLGRWLSLDPLMAQFPWMSPYVAFDDNPVLLNDPSGLATDDWVAKKRIDENGVEHHTWKWVDKSYGSLGEAQADGYIDWMGKGGVVQDMHTSSGYVGPVTLLDGGEHYKGNLPEETAETAMRGKLESTVGETGMTQSQIDAAFNPEKEIVIGTIQEGLAQQISEQNEADLNRLKTRMNLENFNRGLDNLVLGMFGFAYTAPFVIGGGIVYGGAAISSTGSFIGSTVIPRTVSLGYGAYKGIRWTARTYHYTFGKTGGYLNLSTNYVTQSISTGSANPMDHNMFEYAGSAFVGKFSIQKQCIIGGSSGLINYTPNQGTIKHLFNQNIGITLGNTVNGATAPLYNLLGPGPGYIFGNTQQSIMGRGMNNLENSLNK